MVAERGEGLRGRVKVARDGLLLKAREAARLLGLSRTEFYRLNSKGVLPAPVPFGRVRRWSRAVLQRWVEQGCPPRDR